jgi:putative hydrolase of the HAD superfamily
MGTGKAGTHDEIWRAAALHTSDGFAVRRIMKLHSLQAGGIAMTPYPKAILFDLDDTLISFDGVTHQAWDECCGDFIRRREPGLSKQDLLRAVREAGAWYWGDPARHKAGRENLKEARRQVVQLALGTLGMTDPETIFSLADRYTARQDELIHLYPNTLSTLGALRAAGVRLTLITNGSSEGQRAKLTRFGLADFFEHILIDQELGFGKPEVRVFWHALELMRLDARECWMVGDNLVWDIQPPQVLGIRAAWHDWRGKGLDPGSKIIPDRIIRDVGELLLPEG